MIKLEGSQIQDFDKIRSSSADNQLSTQRQNYRTLLGWITISPCKSNHTTPQFLVPVKFGPFSLSACSVKFGPFLSHLAQISDLRFWTLRFFWISKFLNIFSYRADTSIPATFVAIRVVGSNPRAYLCFSV